MQFVKELGRRILCGLKIIVKILLLLPIPLFMVAFSYKVDRSGLFQGDLAPRTVVELLLAGEDVTNFEQMDERQIVRLYAQDVPAEQVPTTVGIGSSRVLQFTTDLVGTSLFNLGVTGADVRDNMTSYYVMVRDGKTPDVLLWSVDPWVLHGGEKSFDSRADGELYNEFLQNVLGVDTGYEEPDQVELWKALAEPAYFQGNVDYYFKTRGGQLLDDNGEAIPFAAVTGDVFDQPATIKRSDGSVLYDPPFRNQKQEEILLQAMATCDTFSSIHMEGFDALDQTQCRAFAAFIDYARAQGTTVILVLSPLHPYLYDYLLWQEATHQGFLQVETWLREYAAANKVPLYGSYDPLRIDGLEEMDFFDGVHCKDSGIAKFFPGVPAVLECMALDTLPDPLATLPRTTAEERCPW